MSSIHLNANKATILVVGNGMTGYKFCEKFVDKGLMEQYNLVVFGEEPWAAYDRVHLTDYYTGTDVHDLKMAPRSWYEDNGITLITSDPVVNINRDEKQITSSRGHQLNYKYLVLATGSAAFVPPVPGIDKTGVFVYRTIEDLDNIKSYIKDKKDAVVIGGGLLGLEAAKALMDDGLKTSIIEFAPRLMPRQLDETGGSVLKQKLEDLKLEVKLNKSSKLVLGNGSVTGIEFADGEVHNTDVIVVSAGIRPRDELARQCGLQLGERGGILTTPDTLTSDSSIFAIGECALIHNMIWGLVAPCYDMADVAVKRIAGEEAEFSPADLSTKLKLIGVDVASFGDVFGEGDGRKELVYENKATGNYKKLFVSEDGSKLLGGILVGDAADYNTLFQLYSNEMKLPENLDSLLFTSDGGGLEFNVLDLADDAVICSCENITKGNIVTAIEEGDLTNIGQIKKCTKAGTGCGGCAPMLNDLMDAVLKASGKEVKKVICEHFAYTRQELYDLVKVEDIKDFSDLIHKHGKGQGCELCKPLAASLFASIYNTPVPQQSAIQDTNDRFLANIQRGGSYSVVPRIPGGEITPDKLIVIGEVAKKYELYTKITGGQRIDLFGAKVHELPLIWEELIAAGFESGHAYGKSLRTVKSCVGSTWCRYGQQDSVSFAIEIENRYKGLRSPHKLKGGVSGCIRECAEARGKDFGIIATEKGYNLYVCGNGGANPVHAVLLATDIDAATTIKYLDRFLMYYIKTAGPLTRTAKWLAQLEGGIDHLKEVVIDDSLGLCAQLENDMQGLVDTYQCEWRTAVENPQHRSQYRHFINSEEDGSSLKFIPMRGQKRPADWVKEEDPIAIGVGVSS